MVYISVVVDLCWTSTVQLHCALVGILYFAKCWVLVYLFFRNEKRNERRNEILDQFHFIFQELVITNS